MSTNHVAPRDSRTRGLTENRAPVGYWYIYFYGTEDGNEVKLGKTRQAPTDRRLQHENQHGHDQPMRTLAVVLGQAADEAVLKRHFAPWRSRTRSQEWIEAGEEMRGYLRWLRGQSHVATGELDLAALTPVDSAYWLPTSDRYQQPRQLRLADDDPWSDLHVDHVAEGDFYTHPVLIEAATKAMGSIDLDPASCREANTVVGATQYWGFRENGLLQEWGGNVWLNPPFGNWAEWVPKTIAEWKSGRIAQMCVLSSSRVSTAQQFHPLVQNASALFIACGRYAFWGPKAAAGPDEGHFVFYFGPHIGRFQAAFAHLGSIFLGAAA
jgi:hypothetical protein